MKLQFLGGASEVGASCTVLEAGRHRVVVDAGIRMNPRDGDSLPDLARLQGGQPPTAILVTHAHMDHVGALPLVHLAFPQTPVYTTGPTLSLMRILLQDSLKIMESRWEKEQDVPLYPPQAVAGLLARVREVPPCEKVPLDEGRLQATFTPSGHVLGCCSILLDTEEGRVLFSGDYSVDRQRTVEGMLVPRVHPHVVLSEATYGNRLHANRRAEEERLARTVAEVIAAGGKVLVPAFALGRAQEVLLVLLAAQSRGEIPRFPIYVDGMVKNVCAAYAAHAEFLGRDLRRQAARGNPFFPAEGCARPVSAPERQALLDGPPCCFVSSSGMLTGGPSVLYAAQLAADPRNAILITGYQDEESPGRRLLDLAEARTHSLFLQGREVQVACRVERYGLSAHADQAQMAGVLHRLSPHDVVLVHGDDEARASLAGALAESVRVHLPANGDEVELPSYTRGSRRPAATRYPGIGGGQPFDAQALRQFLLSTPHLQRPWTVRELAELWHGSDRAAEGVEEVRARLQEPAARGLAADPKRPFLYRALPDAELERLEAGRRKARKAAPEDGGGPMDQAGAIEVAREVLSGDAELYRTSAHMEDRVLALAFHFPEVARKRHEERFADIERRTGWSVRVYPEVHMGALMLAAREALPAGWAPTREPSYFREDAKVRVRLAPPPAERDFLLEVQRRVGESFQARTGHLLELEEDPGTPAAAQAFRADGRMEQNLAFTAIREAFRSAGVEVFRVSLRSDPGAGDKWVEVGLISPQVAARHADMLPMLTERTGWTLRFGREPNQDAIKRKVRELLPDGWSLRKEPGFHKELGLVRLAVAPPPPAQAVAELAARVEEATGMRLECT